MIGDPVLCHGKKYMIVHMYTSNFCEIKEVRNPFHVELVHISDMTFLNKKEIDPTVHPDHIESIIERTSIEI